MYDFYEDFLVPALVFAGSIVAILMLAFSLVFCAQEFCASFNCSRWTTETGQPTKVIAAQCFVMDHGKPVDFDSYVKQYHLKVQTDGK